MTKDKLVILYITYDYVLKFVKSIIIKEYEFKLQ